MKNDKTIISKDMFEGLKKKLKELLKSKKELNKSLEQARQSDVSEDTDSIAAVTNELGKINMRVEDIEDTLENVTIMKKKKGCETKIGIGSTVKVKVGGKIKKFTIVSDIEANPLEGKISNKSPLGKGLMKAKKGKKVTIPTDDGSIEYEVIELC